MSGFAEPSGPPLVLVTADPSVRRRVEAAARTMEAVLLGFVSMREVRLPADLRAFVVDVTLEGAGEAIALVRRERPAVPVVGVLALPRPDLWSGAEQAGADVVLTPGTVARRLPGFLDSFTRARPSVRVAESRDLDGRLGCVARLTENVPEPIAVWRVGYALHAAGDVCPHAGARLSEGDLEGAVVTCPRHGSRFDVTTGERLRGPADEGVRSYDVVVRDGVVFVEMPGGIAPSAAEH